MRFRRFHQQALDRKSRETAKAIPYHTTFFQFNLVFCLTTQQTLMWALGMAGCRPLRPHRDDRILLFTLPLTDEGFHQRYVLGAADNQRRAGVNLIGHHV